MPPIEPQSAGAIGDPDPNDALMLSGPGTIPPGEDDAPNVSQLPDNLGDVVGVSGAGLPLVQMPDGPQEIHPRGLDAGQSAQYATHLAGMQAPGATPRNGGGGDPNAPGVSDEISLLRAEQGHPERDDIDDSLALLRAEQGHPERDDIDDSLALLRAEQGEPAQLTSGSGGKLGMVRDFVLRAMPSMGPPVRRDGGTPAVTPESAAPPHQSQAADEADHMEWTIEHPEEAGLTKDDVPWLRESYEQFLRKHWDSLPGRIMTNAQTRMLAPEPGTEPPEGGGGGAGAAGAFTNAAGWLGKEAMVALPPQKVEQEVASAAEAAGVSPSLARAVTWQESKFNSDAVSLKGAIGAGQLMPKTARELGVNPNDPEQNAKGSATYLKKMIDRFSGNETMAVAAYNAGPGAVEKSLRDGGADWLKKLPAETQAYVPAVLGKRAEYEVGSGAGAPPDGNGLAGLGGRAGGVGPDSAPIKKPADPDAPSAPLDADRPWASMSPKEQQGAQDKISSLAADIASDPARLDDFAKSRGISTADAAFTLAHPEGQNAAAIYNYAHVSTPTAQSPAPASSSPASLGPGRPQASVGSGQNVIDEVGGAAATAAKPYQDIAKDYADSAKDLGVQLGDEGTAKAKAAKDLLSDLAPTQEDQDEVRRTALADGRLRMQEYDKAMQDYRQQHVDPDHWWSSRSAGQKAMGILGVLVSGLSGTADNKGMDVLQKSIDRDIDAQQKNIGIAKDYAGSRENLFQMNQRLLGDNTAAVQATQAMLWKSYQAKLEQAAGTAGTKAERDKASMMALDAKARYEQAYQGAYTSAVDNIFKMKSQGLNIQQQQRFMDLLAGGSSGSAGASEAARSAAYHQMNMGYVPGVGAVPKEAEKDVYDLNASFQPARVAMSRYIAVLKDPTSDTHQRDEAAGFAKAALGHYFESRGAAAISDDEKNAVNAIVNPGWWRNFAATGMAADRAQHALGTLVASHDAVLGSYTGSVSQAAPSFR